MDYNKLLKEVHQNAENKGFWKESKSDEHCLALVFTEVCEAIEAGPDYSCQTTVKLEKDKITILKLKRIC